MPMADDALNRIDAATEREGAPGDIPDGVRRRYFSEARAGAAAAYYTDASTTRPAFKDEGRRLTTDRNDPHVVGDLLAIAAHRGWSTIQVRGETRFRREVWLQGEALGIEVRGYRPTERDRQELARQTARPEREGKHGDALPRAHAHNAITRMRVVETVVEARVRDPQARHRILTTARARIAGWLERGPPGHTSPPRDRHRDR